MRNLKNMIKNKQIDESKLIKNGFPIIKEDHLENGTETKNI